LPLALKIAFTNAAAARVIPVLPLPVARRIGLGVGKAFRIFARHVELNGVGWLHSETIRVTDRAGGERGFQAGAAKLTNLLCRPRIFR
jgi:hypothetical protein